MILKYLLQKEFLQIKRNSFLPRLIIVFPIMIMCVMPWVMNMEVKNIRVDVVDNDRSTLSERLVHRIEASRYFTFNGLKSDYGSAMTDIERSSADIVVVIPQHYERDYVSGTIPQVLVAANAVNGSKGSLGGSYVSNIIADNITTSLKNHDSQFSELSLFNPRKDYKVFMIPALMAMLLVMCGFLPSLNIVGEKVAGTIEQINVTPVSKMSFIFAKLIPYWIIGMVVMTICFLLSWLIYGITSVGSLALIYLISMLLAFIFSGFGLIVSNYSDALQQAMFVMWFFMVCMLLLSGLFTPVRSMPDWAQTITIVNPMRYFIDAIRTVFVRGGTFHSIAIQVYVLALFAVIMDVWAVISYRKNN